MAPRPLSGEMPELGALDLFASVIRLGSLSKAAAAHHISQPSASARIRTLEHRLGLRLLARTPAGSLPTTAGALVAQWSADVLEAASRLLDGAETLRSPGTASMRIAASYTIAEHLIPRWLAVFHRSEPDAVIALQVMNSVRVAKMVLGHEVDLGFIESVTVPEGLDSCVVAADELVLVVGEGHPWRNRSDPVPISLLSRTPLVLREDGSGTREVLECALHARGASLPPVALELGSTAAIKYAVADGVGPAVLSQLAVAADEALGRLFVVETVGLDLHRALRAVWPAGQQPSKLSRSLLNQLQPRP